MFIEHAYGACNYRAGLLANLITEFDIDWLVLTLAKILPLPKLRRNWFFFLSRFIELKSCCNRRILQLVHQIYLIICQEAAPSILCDVTKSWTSDIWVWARSDIFYLHSLVEFQSNFDLPYTVPVFRIIMAIWNIP